MNSSISTKIVHISDYNNLCSNTVRKIDDLVINSPFGKDIGFRVYKNRDKFVRFTDFVVSSNKKLLHLKVKNTYFKCERKDGRLLHQLDI